MATTEIEEIREILKEVALSQKISQKASSADFQEIRERFKETDKQIKETIRKISDLGDKFGYFTEGMALPTMEKILYEKFQLDTIMPRFTKKLPNGDFLEYDVFGYRNSTVNNAVIVEIKSKLRRDDVVEMVKELNAFSQIFPEHANKHLYGIIVAVDVPNKDLINQVEQAGLYFARICDDIFSMNENKMSKDFNAS